MSRKSSSLRMSVLKKMPLKMLMMFLLFLPICWPLRISPSLQYNPRLSIFLGLTEYKVPRVQISQHHKKDPW